MTCNAPHSSANVMQGRTMVPGHTVRCEQPAGHGGCCNAGKVGGSKPGWAHSWWPVDPSEVVGRAASSERSRAVKARMR